MNSIYTRRRFLKTSAITSGCIPLFRTGLRAQDESGQSDELTQLYLRLQRRDAHEKAVLFKKLVQAFGPQVLKAVEKNTIDETRIQMQSADLPRRDLQAVMDVLWNPAKDLLDFEVEEKSDTFLKIRVSRCLFAEEMRKQEASEIGFAFYCAYDYGFCEGLNPKIKFTRTQTLMMGDAICDHTYELSE